MAINLGLNIITNVKDNHTVTVDAGSGVTLTSVSSNSFNSTKRLTVSATEGVTKQLCTVRFTAGTNLYYSSEPEFIENIKNANLSVTSVKSTDSLGRVNTITFTISLTSEQSSLYNILTFNENIEVSSASGANNTVLKQIDSVKINKSNIDPNGESRIMQVFGKENSKFSSKITRSSDSKTYDFTSNTFTTSATTSPIQQITSSGVFDTTVFFPSASVLETYTIETTADFSNNTLMISSLADEGSVVKNSFTIKQLNNASVTFTCISSDSSYTGTHGSKPSSTAISGAASSASDEVNYIELQPKLHTKAFKKAREIATTDFEFRTTASVASGDTSTSVTLSSANSQIIPGMTVTGTGITNSVTVSTISGTALVLSGTPGGTVSGTLTFIGGGKSFIKEATGLVFEIINTAGESSSADLVINDVNKTANADSTGTTITIANAEDDAVGTVVGVYVEASTIKDSANANGRLVSDVSSSQNTIVVNANTTIRSGQVITFTGAGRVAEISFQLNITQFPTSNTTVNINLDNFLTIDPNWS